MDNDDGAKQMSPRGAMFFGMGFAGFACLFMLIGAGMAWSQAAKLGGWLPVTATVGGGEIKVNRDSDGDTYAPVVHFTYRVGGVEHTAHTPQPMEISSGDRGAAQRVVARFTPGQQVTAWYNPAAPDEAYLIREADFFPYLFILFPMLHFTAGLAVWWFAGARNLTARGKARRLGGIAAIWSAVGILCGAHYASIGGAFDVLAVGAFCAYGAVALGLFLGWSALARKALAAPTVPSGPAGENPFTRVD